MTKSTLRTLIVVLTLITAGVHLILLNMSVLDETGSIDIPFTLNGLGYLALLAALLYGFPAGREKLVHYAFIAYTLVTILAWYFINGDFTDPVGVFTKTVEVLLIVFLWMHLQRD